MKSGFYKKKIVCSSWSTWKLLTIKDPGSSQDSTHPEFTQVELDELGEYENNIQSHFSSLSCIPNVCDLPVGLIAPYFAPYEPNLNTALNGQLNTNNS